MLWLAHGTPTPIQAKNVSDWNEQRKLSGQTVLLNTLPFGNDSALTGEALLSQCPLSTHCGHSREAVRIDLTHWLR
jgi:hypothetical protein